MSGVEIYNELIRAQLQNSASDLSPTSTGLIYFNTTSNIAKLYNGSSWKTFLFADLSNITGTLGIANGGTGQTSQTAAFDALAPTTTKGDVIAHNGSDNVRIPVGSDGQVLTADSTQSAGVKWGASAVVPGTAGGVYSDGSALQSVAFSGNANEIFGVNSGATSAEYKALSTGSTGTDFNIAHSAGSIAFNLPDASSSNRGAVTTGTQTLAGNKTLSGTTVLGTGTQTHQLLGKLLCNFTTENISQFYTTTFMNLGTGGSSAFSVPANSSSLILVVNANSGELALFSLTTAATTVLVTTGGWAAGTGAGTNNKLNGNFGTGLITITNNNAGTRTYQAMVWSLV